ncbi:MAG: DUF1778 domain-containing protein [Phycicoccus sp.]
MKSLRLAPDLEARLQDAARVRGESVSEFVRRAVDDRADATLAASADKDFADVLGVIHGGGGRATGAVEFGSEGASRRRTIVAISGRTVRRAQPRRSASRL